MDGPAFRQVERHLLRRIETIQNHEDDTTARVSRPIICRMCGIGDVIVIDAPSERRETLAYDRVLVDLDDVFVPRISKVSSEAL